MLVHTSYAYRLVRARAFAASCWQISVGSSLNKKLTNKSVVGGRRSAVKRRHFLHYKENALIRVMLPALRHSFNMTERSGRMRTTPVTVGLSLATVLEGPTNDSSIDWDSEDDSRRWSSVVGCSFVSSIMMSNGGGGRLLFTSQDCTRMMMGVLGCPLSPVALRCPSSSGSDDDGDEGCCFPVRISLRDAPIETSSAQYIVQQYASATGCSKYRNLIKNSYTMGKIRMSAEEYETPSKISKNFSKSAETGCFILWQFMPDMWSMELVMGCNKVSAGCNGQLVWRHTPWLGSHVAKGPARPLRRAIQGLDPLTSARMFLNARCVGEKRIGEEDCFTLKLAATPAALSERSDGFAEIIRHALFGYFSQRTGLLVFVEDSHLTRIESPGGDAVYWETTIETTIENYKSVDGIMIAHSGRSVVTLFKFGGQPGINFTKIRMVETCEIQEIVFNVPGLSIDSFIPPSEVRRETGAEDSSLLITRNVEFVEPCQKPIGLLKYDSHLLV